MKLGLVKIVNFKVCGGTDVWLRFFVDVIVVVAVVAVAVVVVIIVHWTFDTLHLLLNVTLHLTEATTMAFGHFHPFLPFLPGGILPFFGHLMQLGVNTQPLRAQQFPQSLDSHFHPT